MAWRSNIASCLNLQSSCKREAFCHNMSSLSWYVYVSHTMESLHSMNVWDKNSENWSCTYALFQIMDLKPQFQNVCFLWQEFPWSWKLFCCRLRWDIFHPTDSYFRRSALALMEASWWHRWWLVRWPQISGLSTRCLPWGLQLINFLREILGLWIKTWRRNKVKCQTGFCIVRRG